MIVLRELCRKKEKMPMIVQERILTIRIIEKLKKNPGYQKELHLKFTDIKRKKLPITECSNVK